MEITKLWEVLSQPSQSLDTFRKDVAEGKVPELPFYIVGQKDLKKRIEAKLKEIDSQRMTTSLIVAEYGNGKTNLLKYLQLFFNHSHKELGVTVHYSRADIDRPDLVLFLLKIVQDNYIEELANIIKEVRVNTALIPTFVNNYQNNFSEIKEYTECLFSTDNSDAAIVEILHLGTGRLSNKRYFDKHSIAQLKDFNRREVLVLLLNILSHSKKYIIFSIDEIEKIAEKSKIRFNHFLTTYRELVDLFNQIKGHYLLISMTNKIDSNYIDEANPALYTRIKNDIIDLEALSKDEDIKELIQYLNDLFEKNEDVVSIYSQLRKVERPTNRILIQEISKLLYKEEVVLPLSELLINHNVENLYTSTKDKLSKDDAFKNLHRKFFDPLEYYIESIGIDSKGLNKRDRTLIDEKINIINYFIFNSDIVDFENEKIKILKLINDNPDKKLVVFSPEDLGMTNSIIGIEKKLKIVDYFPDELFILLEMYRGNFDLQPELSEVISYYSKQNL